MNRDTDFNGLLQNYLDEHEGHTPLPEEARDAIRAELPSTHQRPAWWPEPRYTPMHPILKFALVAAALAAVAVVGLNYIAAPSGALNVGGGEDGDPASTTPSTTRPTATPIPLLPQQEDLEAGTYRANPFIPIEVLVTVPNGWTGGGDWLLLGPRGVSPPDGMNIRFGSVTNIYVDPLDRAEGYQDPAVGPTVDDLVDAMMSHPDWPTSGPADVSVDGYSGKVVRLTLPADLDIPADGFLLFQDGEGGDRWAFERGQIIDFYIIDVDGERLVLELFSYPDTPSADLSARQAIVDSLQLSR